MGTDAMSVVGPDLKVHGLDGLRVADASVVPFLVSANTNAAAYVIAERCADLLTKEEVPFASVSSRDRHA